MTRMSKGLHVTGARFSTAFARLSIFHLRAHADAILVAPVAQLLVLIDGPPRKEADARVVAVTVRRAHSAEVEVRITREVDARSDLVRVRVIGLGLGLGLS